MILKFFLFFFCFFFVFFFWFSVANLLTRIITGPIAMLRRKIYIRMWCILLLPLLLQQEQTNKSPGPLTQPLGWQKKKPTKHHKPIWKMFYFATLECIDHEHATELRNDKIYYKKPITTTTTTRLINAKTQNAEQTLIVR